MSASEALLFVIVSLSSLLVLRRALDGRMLDVSRFAGVLAPLNAVRFAIRRALRISRGAPKLAHEDKEGLFSYLDADSRARAARREAELRARYRLERLEGCSTREAYRENLFVLDVLDAFAGEYAKTSVPVDGTRLLLDVGSKDFVYAPALAAFARGEGAALPATVTGIELDGHVLYRDLRSRADHAQAYAALAGPGTSYVVANFLDYRPSSPAWLVTMFFPFVTRFALLQWGLPATEYRPEALLAHAARLLVPGGMLLVVNHTHEEQRALAVLAAAQRELELVTTRGLSCELLEYGADVPERTVSTFRKFERR